MSDAPDFPLVILDGGYYNSFWIMESVFDSIIELG